jgi:hypothetical protein
MDLSARANRRQNGANKKKSVFHKTNPDFSGRPSAQTLNDFKGLA